MRNADRFRFLPFIAAFVFFAAAGALWIGARRVERRETLTQHIPALQADPAGISEPVRLGGLDVTVDRPIRLLAGSESRIDIQFSAEGTEAVPNLSLRLMSDVVFVNADVSDGTAFFLIETDSFPGSAHARIRSYANETRLIGEWTLAVLFFDSEDALDPDHATDRWVRVSKTLEIDVSRFMGMDAAAVKRLIMGLCLLAGLLTVWGGILTVRIKKRTEAGINPNA